MPSLRSGLLAGVAVALLAACSSTSTSSSSAGPTGAVAATTASGVTIPAVPSPGVASSAPTATPPATSSPTRTAAASSASSSVALSGAWSGKYDGTYKGTLTLTWTQSGIRITGSIKLSDPSVTASINGLLKADTITFETTGSPMLVYEGTFSRTSMSGRYHVGATGGGTWSATRS